MTTPIRETIARAICFERADCDIWSDISERDRRAYRDEADRVLRALDEAGCVVVRKERADERD